MDKIMKRQNGITLVALIITIIVMLILAGVAISMAVGDNGIIERTQAAIKESERADIQEIIIGSYVFKVTASMNNFAYIDIPKTGIAIFENLEANGFEVKNPDKVVDNGVEVPSAPLVKDESTGEYKGIEVTVKGEHGEYFGTVESGGLVGDVEEKEIIEEETPVTPEPNPDLENEGLRIAYGKKYKCIDSTSDMNGKYITIFESGEAEGDMIMLPTGAEMTFEIKEHVVNIGGVNTTYQAAVLVSINGAEAFFVGFFDNYNNEYYTELKILEDMDPDLNGVYKDNWTTLVLEDRYSFTINDFDTYTAEADSRIGLDITQIWEIVGADLSQNTDYVMEPDSTQPMFVLTTDNILFQGYFQVAGGAEELRSETKYGVFADIAFGRFELAVFDIQGNDALDKNPTGNEISYDEFVRLYGDVEFEFVKITQ